MTRVAAQVAAPEIIAPYVIQGCCWLQVLEQKNQYKTDYVTLSKTMINAMVRYALGSAL